MTLIPINHIFTVTRFTYTSMGLPSLLCNNEVIDQGKYRKRASKRKWTDREYHVQDNADVSHKYVKMYCDTNQFSALPFCGPHTKPHVARGLSKHNHLRFDQKLVWGYVQFAV